MCEQLSLVNLPNELHLRILLALPVLDVCRNAALVCKAWYELSTTEIYWKEMCLREGFNPENKPSIRGWRWFYLSYQPYRAPKTPSSESAREGFHSHFLRIGMNTDKEGIVTAGEYNTDSKLEGYGRATAKNIIMEGMWSNGKLAGPNNKWAYTDTETYQGATMNGKCDGYGVYHWPNGDVYEGEWINDERHGKGTYKWNPIVDKEEGAKPRYIKVICTGEWKNNSREGYGVNTWSDGRSYAGEWQNGEFYGHGVYEWPDGTRYEGKWEKGYRQGYGTIRWLTLSGDLLTWSGEWNKDVPQAHPSSLTGMRWIGFCATGTPQERICLARQVMTLYNAERIMRNRRIRRAECV